MKILALMSYNINATIATHARCTACFMNDNNEYEAKKQKGKKICLLLVSLLLLILHLL